MSDLLLTARARQIIAQTATAFYCDADDVYSVRREADLVTARHVAMYVLQAGFGLSTTRIGRLLHRDHATVIYGIRRVKASPELLGRAQPLLASVKRIDVEAASDLSDEGLRRFVGELDRKILEAQGLRQLLAGARS